MKGIILAGGNGTRLYPLTTVTSKQLLPIYDKPMIYYPLSTLMLAGINHILLISTPIDLSNFRKLLGDGSQFGITLEYAEQPSPDGLAQAFLIGEAFIKQDSCALILGDNIFYGSGFRKTLLHATEKAKSNIATIFGYYVNDPQRFGIVELNGDKVISIEEKPAIPKSNYCITGLYFFDNRAIEFARNVVPSSRGELEITDIIRQYLDKQELSVEILGRGYAWLDTGTIDTLIDAGQYIQIIEKRQGIKLSIPEEIAYINKWLTKEQLLNAAEKYQKSPYGEYLRKVAENRIRYS
jgi:glucose-1-phosphate thymidylyltransferase